MKKLNENTTCEVLIIGAGITGLLAAYKFRDSGYDVLLIDKEEVANHSTRRNTGLIQYSSDAMLHKMIKGNDSDAVTFYKESLTTVKEIDEISQSFSNQDACKKSPSLYLASCNSVIS